MGGISVAHGENRVPSPIRESPESIQLQNAGTITMTSRVDTTPHDVELQPYSLTADWLGLGHKGNAIMGGYSPVPVSEILTNRGR